jgi:uncharacterized delta-60 repeat protein
MFGINLRAQVNQVWAAEFNGTGNSADFSHSMAIDLSGNTYVTGESYTTAGNYDYITIKYNTDGDIVWTRYYNGTGNNRDVGRSITVDVDGNVYVTGESYGSGDYDIATVKYNSVGVQQWAVRYNGPANGADGSSAITVDTSGNVYITGYSDGDASPAFRQDDYVTIKYNSSGTADWVIRYNGPGNFHDTPNAIAVDKNNNVYVTGGSSGVGTRYDYATIKYDYTGNQLWVESYNGPANFDDIANAIVVDDSGNVFVTGSSDGTSLDNSDFATIKYNTDGMQLWLARYDGPGGADDAYSMALDGNGSLYVTGESKNPVVQTTYDYLTIRYNEVNGDSLWTARYNGPAGGNDIPLSVIQGNSGNVYVTGYSDGGGSGNDYATLKYNNTGQEEWLIRFNGAGNGSDIANTVRVDTMGNVYVTGSSFGNGTANDIVTIKYSQSPTFVNQISSILPEEYYLFQNYPNPFNPSTTISWQLPVGSRQTLIIYDVLGNEVTTLVDEYKPAGSYQIEFDASSLPSGIYFYKLQSDNYVKTKKMILMK